MTANRQIPTALSVVSWLFLLSGIAAVIHILVQLSKGSVFFDFDVLGLWIFFGLRRFSPGWRTCALFFIWVGLIALPFLFVYGFVGEGPAYLNVFGQRYGDVPMISLSIVAALLFLLELWMYRVLTRPDTRQLFYSEVQSPLAP